MELSELASRIEAASGPDRELDTLIAEALNIQWMNEWGDLCDFDRKVTVALNYTASLDAALTLVPEGAGIMLKTPNSTLAKHGFPGMPCGASVHFGGNPETKAAAAATPALALCAAALRAQKVRP